MSEAVAPPVFVLDSAVEIALCYRHHVPKLAPFLQAAPRQLRSPAFSDVIPSTSSEPATLPPAAQRKRKRQQRAPADPRYALANERHAAVAPALAAALDSLTSWLDNSSCHTLHEAVLRCCGSGAGTGSALAPCGAGSGTAAPGAVTVIAPCSSFRDSARQHLLSQLASLWPPQVERRLLPGAQGGGSNAALCGGPVADGVGSGDERLGSAAQQEEVNFISLAAMKRVLRPKLLPQLPPPGSGGCGDGPQEAVGAGSSGDCSDGPQEANGAGASGICASSRSAERAHNVFDSCVYNAAAGDEAMYVVEPTGVRVLLPPRCAFLMSDVGRLQPLMAGGVRYDCIVIDPPWENASARRSACYPTLPNLQLLALPVPALLQAGGLVALWVTNREKLRSFVEAELLPAWGLRPVATWYWLKVTSDGRLMGPLDAAHRRPYEALVLATAAAPAKGGNSWLELPTFAALAAVPAQHSRKPPLRRLLQGFAPTDAKFLELFARQLDAGCTAWGNEVLRFQQAETYFEAL